MYKALFKDIVLYQIAKEWDSVWNEYLNQSPNQRMETSTIKDQKWLQHEHNWNPIDRDHVHPKIRNGGEAKLREPPPCVSEWGPAQLKIISAQLSAIEAQLIPGGWLSIKNRNGGRWRLLPHHFWRWGSAQLKIVAEQLSTIGEQLNQHDSTLKFGMGGGAGETFPRITFYSWVQ